jgi:hypothetical protein
MEWGFKGVVTAATVAAVLMTLRVFGRRAAGLAAGMPVITAPALCWVAREHGDRFAAQAAVGCVAVCAALALFAPCYARLAQRAGPAIAAPLTLVFTALVIALLPHFGPELAPPLLLAAGGCVVASQLMPVDGARPSPMRRLGCEVLIASIAAAGVSMLAAWSAPLIGSFAASVLMSLPIVTTTSAVHQHVTAGAAGVTRLLHGNLAGTVGRVFFCAAFALTIDPLTVGEALVVSCAAGIIGAAIAARALARMQAAAVRRAAR